MEPMYYVGLDVPKAEDQAARTDAGATTVAVSLHQDTFRWKLSKIYCVITDPKVTQDSYIVVKSNATTKAMRRVDAGGLLKAWKKSR